MLKTRIQICIQDSISYLFAIKEKRPKNWLPNNYRFRPFSSLVFAVRPVIIAGPVFAARSVFLLSSSQIQKFLLFAVPHPPLRVSASLCAWSDLWISEWHPKGQPRGRVQPQSQPVMKAGNQVFQIWLGILSKTRFLGFWIRNPMASCVWWRPSVWKYGRDHWICSVFWEGV